MKKLFVPILCLLIYSVVVSSCKKKKMENAEDDIYNEILQSGYTYYQNGALLSAAAASPHGSFKLRFNNIAQAALDTSGEIPTGNSFPEGAIIVKEIYNGSQLALYAIMKKDPADKYAGSGWLWTEFDPEGNTVYSISQKGEGCISCHSVSPNRDLVRTFDLH